eukprot:2535253-Amphidinium_carterae.2
MACPDAGGFMQHCPDGGGRKEDLYIRMAQRPLAQEYKKHTPTKTATLSDLLKLFILSQEELTL